jgi:hypothetical protein
VSTRGSLLAAVVALAVAAPAAPAADQRFDLSPSNQQASWPGPTATAFNTTFAFPFPETTGTGSCGKGLLNFCHTTLVFTGDEPLPPAAKLVFRIDGFEPHEDLDLRLQRLDPSTFAPLETLSPARRCPVSEGTGPVPLLAGDAESCTVGVKRGQVYLLEVVYFAVPGGDYRGSVALSGVPAPPSP